MVKEEDRSVQEVGITKEFPAWSMPKPCDACRIASALLFCRADSAFLCHGCDLKVHGANKLASRHERVWVCEVCEQAPAVVTCKADDAALCVSCDSDIHSANPLARRHERVPVVPFFECASMVKAAHGNVVVPSLLDGLERSCDGLLKDEDENDEIYAAEAASWLLPNPKHAVDAVTVTKNGALVDGGAEEASFSVNVNCNGSGNRAFMDRAVKLNVCAVGSPRTRRDKAYMQSGIDFFPDVDPFLDLEYASSIETTRTGTDSVVPVQNQSTLEPASTASECFDADVSCKGGYCYTPATSLSHSVSSSSLDVGVVPDATLNDISTPFKRGMFELATPAVHVGVQYVPMDREARVMRYKEKRKNRKFEKTIRYASRKAYAETRPRIKGRFAKRTDVDVEQMYRSSDPFGLVPTF
eukprot:Gb_41704 [translate_table: standard]